VKEYLDDIVRSLQTQFKRTKHQLRVSCDETLMLNGYPGTFAQVVTNLVMNSLTHGFSPDQEGLIDIDVQERDEQCVMTYRDNGRGMSPEVLSRIFDPFFTTNRGGGSTGLGLHVLFNIVTQKFGGTVRCDSSPGQGVAFEIRFPADCEDKNG
jgi:signal transduction histidine kinase